MKKYCASALFLSFLIIGSTQAADVDMSEIDAEARANRPTNNSLLFRRNAEDYRQLSDAEKNEIAARREEALRIRKQQEELMRRQAEEEARQRAMEEEARKRAEALKPITLYENKLKIYALVNGEPITSSDMQSRINAFILTTGIPYNAKTKGMITGKVLQAAIDEKIKLQEAAKNKIRVSKHELDTAVAQFERSNNMPSGSLRKILNDAKVSMSVWTNQIKSDIAWHKLVSRKGLDVVYINENDINKAMAGIKNDMKVQKYMLSEIVIAKKDAKDINQLSEMLRHDPRFELYAMQFSQSPSSGNGGRLGWVVKGQLPAALEQKAFALKEGDVSNPILFGQDYYIFKMEKIFNPERDAKNMPTRADVKTMLQNKKLEEYSNKYLQDLRNRAFVEKKV